MTGKRAVGGKGKKKGKEKKGKEKKGKEKKEIFF